MTDKLPTALSRIADNYHLQTLLLVGCVLPIPFIAAGTQYEIRIMVLTMIFAMFAIGLNIVFAHTDQLYLFLGALAGTSAYANAILTDATGISPIATVVVGVLLAAVIAASMSYVAARNNLTLVVIGIITLGLQLTFEDFVVGARDLTGGSTGIPYSGWDIGVVATAIGVDEITVLYYILLAAMGASLLVYMKLVRSEIGLAFQALRQDEAAAESIGVDAVYYKTLAGFVAGIIIGLSGVFLIQLEGYLLPSMYSFLAIDSLALIMVVIGGVRTTYGPVVGAIIIMLLQEYLRGFGGWRTALLGALLVLLFLYFRQGIVPVIKDLAS